MIETSDSSQVQLSVDLRMADTEVNVRFYSGVYCTVTVHYIDMLGNSRVENTSHEGENVKAVEAALRIATNFDSLGSEEDYKLANSIMPALAEARWIA